MIVLYGVLLVVHIVGALITCLLGSYALVSLWNTWTNSYRFAAYMLAGFASFEIISGTALAVISPTVSAVSVCERVVLYLILVIAVEIALFSGMKKVSVTVPVIQTVAPIAMSLMMLIGALARGF